MLVLNLEAKQGDGSESCKINLTQVRSCHGLQLWNINSSDKGQRRRATSAGKAGSVEFLSLLFKEL